jgi:hypothetical protein
MKKFDIEKAKAGAISRTSDGDKAEYKFTYHPFGEARHVFVVRWSNGARETIQEVSDHGIPSNCFGERLFLAETTEEGA